MLTVTGHGVEGMIPTFAPQKLCEGKCQAADYSARDSQAAVQSHVHLPVRCEHQTTCFFLIRVSREPVAETCDTATYRNRYDVNYFIIDTDFYSMRILRDHSRECCTHVHARLLSLGTMIKV